MVRNSKALEGENLLVMGAIKDIQFWRYCCPFFCNNADKINLRKSCREIAWSKN